VEKAFTVSALGLAAVLALAACASKNGAAAGEFVTASSSFDETQGNVWILNELVSESGKTVLNRQKLESDGMGDVFTLVVDGGRISGKGAPNRYLSSYTLGDDQAITINPIAGTLMMSIADPEGLQEREYFDYLERVNQWLLTGNKLELYSETLEGDPRSLVFTREEHTENT
jgi:heat shock protein HslJ